MASDVLKQKLELHDLGSKELEMRLMGSYPKQEIIVQYGESDLAFIRRLAEHVGISFFFEHGGETDKWEFTDHAHGFGVIEGAEETSDATNDVCPSARRCFSGA